MSGHHPFSNLTRDFSPERRRRVESVKADFAAQTPLREFRRGITWTDAAGGELKIGAEFPEGETVIANFQEEGEPEDN